MSGSVGSVWQLLLRNTNDPPPPAPPSPGDPGLGPGHLPTTTCSTCPSVSEKVPCITAPCPPATGGVAAFTPPCAPAALMTYGPVTGTVKLWQAPVALRFADGDRHCPPVQ